MWEALEELRLQVDQHLWCPLQMQCTHAQALRQNCVLRLSDGVVSQQASGAIAA